MKKIILMLVITLFVKNANGLDHDTKSINKLIDNLLIDKKITEAISKLNTIIIEIKKNDVKYHSSRVLSDYTFGNTRYITTQHDYTCNGQFNNVVDRYKAVLDQLGDINAFTSASDGFILGFLVAIIGKVSKSDIKASGTCLVLASILLTLVQNNKIGKVPYLSYPELKDNNNYFGILTNLGKLLCTIASGSVSYFGTDFLLSKLSDKLSIVSNTMKSHNTNPVQ
ncbi:MAG: hypothetical protein P4L22_02010 [Candidatus Babeliales bacterium]|nr:hypothetical protein [Candidatus Babeliales bacterium]